MIHSHIKQKAHDISTKLPLWNYNQSHAFVCFRAGSKVKMCCFFFSSSCVCVRCTLKMGNFANRANLHTAIFKDLKTKKRIELQGNPIASIMFIAFCLAIYTKTKSVEQMEKEEEDDDEEEEDSRLRKLNPFSEIFRQVIVRTVWSAYCHLRQLKARLEN